MILSRSNLHTAKTVLVKVGSALLAESGKCHFTRIAEDLAPVTHSGKHVVLVSSGAVACGLPVLAIPKRPRDLSLLQAAAATGQCELMNRWRDAFGKHGLSVAQILLTHDDLKDRKRFINVRATFRTLLEHGIIPIVNENDTVAVDEIRFGDNDTLAAMVAALIQADLMVLLTRTDGLLSADPKRSSTPPERIAEVPQVTAALKNLAGNAGDLGTGGMISKLEAARRAQMQGIATIIASGYREQVVGHLLLGQDLGTFFPASSSPRAQSARKRWIGFTLKPRGEIGVDAGAVRALRKGGSLLFAGVRLVVGDFDTGDAVDILTEGTKTPIGRGLVALSSTEARELAGLRTVDARRKAGGRAIPDELIHRDNLTLFDDEEPQ